jgi:hypothetical protein
MNLIDANMQPDCSAEAYYKYDLLEGRVDWLHSKCIEYGFTWEFYMTILQFVEEKLGEEGVQELMFAIQCEWDV